MEYLAFIHDPLTLYYLQKFVTTSSGDSLKSSPQNILVTPTLGDFPTTAEIMQKCLAVNPFELKFKEANQRLGAAGTSQELLEQNGLVPKISIDTPSVSALMKSPIFPSISMLSDSDLKTSDFSKLVQQMKEHGGLSTQQSLDVGAGPRTADVLNTVLDMHHDLSSTSLNIFNHIMPQIGQSLFTTLATPNGSAPNSAGILGLPIPQATSPRSIAAALAAVASTSAAAGLAPPAVSISSASPQHSPRNQLNNTNQLRSPQPDIASAVSAAVQASNAQNGSNLLGALHVDSSWDPRDVKPALGQGLAASKITPQLTPRSDFYNSGEDFGPGASNGYDHNPRSNESEVSSNCGSQQGLATTTPGRGRGRGRTTTADMPPDERRLTILERNKAAAVRYRKRKKEEHDEMIGRVHVLEQEKNQIATQNQVLRRELDRVTALLKERETRCVCLHGLPLSSDLGLGADLQNPNFLHQQNLMQAAMGGLKRTKM
ncbi:unnamed protein product, partial [Mesorhabditis spiculigera]